MKPEQQSPFRYTNPTDEPHVHGALDYVLMELEINPYPIWLPDLLRRTLKKAREEGRPSVSEERMVIRELVDALSDSNGILDRFHWTEDIQDGVDQALARAKELGFEEPPRDTP